MEYWTGQTELWNLYTPQELRADLEQKREIITKAAARKVESKIDHLSKDIDATRKDLFKNTPFTEGEYSSYNPDTGLPKTKVDGEPIGKIPIKKVTNKVQAFNKNHENFKKKAPNRDIYKHLEKYKRSLYIPSRICRLYMCNCSTYHVHSCLIAAT